MLVPPGGVLQYGPEPQYNCGEIDVRAADVKDAPAGKIGVIRSPRLMELKIPKAANLRVIEFFTLISFRWSTSSN